MTCAGVLRRRRGVCSQTRRAPVGATMTDFRRISRHRPWAAAGWRGRGWRGSAPVSRARSLVASTTCLEVARSRCQCALHPAPATRPCCYASSRAPYARPPPSPAQCGVGIDCGHRGLGWAGLGWAGGWHHTATWSQFPGSSAPGCQSCAQSPPSSRVCSRATPHKFANSCRPRTSPALPDLRN